MSVNVMANPIKILIKIFQRKKWKTIARLIKEIKEEPERIRITILGYCASVLLGGDEPRAYVVMECLREPLYTAGKAGLVRGLYEALEAE